MSTTRSAEWFDDETFWRQLYPFIFREQLLVAAPEHAAKAVALANPGASSVLDLCCGPGRISVPLAQAGLSVTGVDRTAFLLDAARERAAAASVSVEWVLSDMRDFVRPEAFDLVLSMFTSFGYFDRQHEDTGVLRNVLTSLARGGTVLIDVVGKEIVATRRQCRVDTAADGARLVCCHEIFDDWTRIRNEWILVRGDKATTYRFHHTLYSGRELKSLMEGVGFVDVNLYGDFDGRPYDHDAMRLIAVGRKW